MDKNLNFEVGDIVRVFTEDETEAFVEVGGNDWDLLELEREYKNTAFGKIRKVTNIYKNGNIDLKCEDGEFDYWYPEEICKLVKRGE